MSKEGRKEGREERNEGPLKKRRGREKWKERVVLITGWTRKGNLQSSNYSVDITSAAPTFPISRISTRVRRAAAAADHFPSAQAERRRVPLQIAFSESIKTTNAAAFYTFLDCWRSEKRGGRQKRSRWPDHLVILQPPSPPPLPPQTCKNGGSEMEKHV